METVLGTAPDSRPFNWKPVLIVFIVLGLLGGGYVLFTTVDFSKMVSKSTPAATPTPAVVKKTPVTPPKKTETPTPPPTPVVINTDSIRQAEEAKAAAALAAKEEEERKQREEAEKEEARLKKERRKEKEEPTKKKRLNCAEHAAEQWPMQIAVKQTPLPMKVQKKQRSLRVHILV